jgi:hypothetical protein
VAFDLFFTVEFLLRSWNAVIKRNFKHYILHENGWVDFAASLPLLIFSSAPVFLSLIDGAVFAGAGTLIGMLKVVKVVRMARILRLLRLVKLFRRIKFANSAMVQRHTIRLITIAASAVIFSVTLIGAVFAFLHMDSLENDWNRSHNAMVAVISGVTDGPERQKTVKILASEYPSLTAVSDNGKVLYSSLTPENRENTGPADYLMIKKDSLSFWFDMRPLYVSQSRYNLTIYLTSLILITLLLLLYIPDFAMSVSDPVNIMLKGMKEQSYNLEVKIPGEYSKDEIFILSYAYNREFLPMKERDAVKQGSNGALDISIDDIGDLLEKP